MTPGEVSLRMKTCQMKEQHAWKVRMAIGLSLTMFAAKLAGKKIQQEVLMSQGVVRFVDA